MLPANRELSGAEIDLVQMDERERQLKTAIDTVSGQYDFVLIDCPPTLSLLTLNGLAAAHGVIIPMQCEVLRARRPVRPGQHHQARAPQYQRRPACHRPAARDVRPRMTLQQQVSAQLESHFGDKVFKTVVPRNVRLAEAPSYGMPGVVYDRASRARRPTSRSAPK